MSKARRFWSWLLLAGGMLLLISGSREFLSSWFSQTEIATEWEEELEHAAPDSEPEPRAPAPVRKGDFIARMSIPRLRTELFVVEGTGKKELRRGPGHLPGTALPPEEDNTVIAGHRDTHFRVLKDIKAGDDIVVEHNGEYFVYRVRNTKIVKPTQREVLRRTGRPMLTLVTCYPFYYLGPAPKRFIVEADLANRVSVSALRRPSESAGM